MTIGVFDSGIGGLSVTNAIKKARPADTVIFKNDAIHMPYGTKSMDEVLTFALPVLESLVEDGVDCVVVACNTVGTNLIDVLRRVLPVPLVSVEPMVKPAAALTKTGVVAVCATPATLASARYAQLKTDYAEDIIVLEPDCSDWAMMIENNQVDEKKIAERINTALTEQADVIVLACTHYHWIEQQIRQLAGSQATILQPEEAIIRQLERVLTNLSQQP